MKYYSYNRDHCEHILVAYVLSIISMSQTVPSDAFQA